MITDEQIQRINELARKSRTQGLTLKEEKEQALLRRAYIDAVKASLEGHLENTYIKEPDGTLHKLGKKE